MRRRTTSADFGEPAHRARDRAGEQEREHDHDARRKQEHAQHRKPLGGDHLVDFGALGREHERTAHRAKARHRNGDRDDHLGAIVDPHHVRLLPGKGDRDLLIELAVRLAELAVGRQVAAREPPAQRHEAPLDIARLRRFRRRQVEAQHVVESEAVENERAVALIDARARVRRRHEPLRAPVRCAPG